MASIGFCAKTPVRPQIEPAKDAIIKFDSGISISREEACYNTLVLGSTGTGKTTSVILPAIGALIEKGHSGLIIDIKGNLSEQVRILATKRGRIDDVVEFGSSKNASKVDLLSGLSISQVRELLTVIATFQFGNMTSNLDWHTKGVTIATECVTLLRYLNEKNNEIQTNLKNLVDILNDWPLAARLFQYFKKHVLDTNSKDQKDFLSRVQSDNFNPLVYDNRKSSSNTFNEQTTWRLGAVRNGLTEFLQNSSIAQNFATSGSGLNLADLIYKQRKIVLLRFDGTSGQVGAWLSRYVLTEYYRAVFENGLKLNKEEYTFFVGDEFQELSDFHPSNRYNDNSFAAKSREYKNVTIVGTQSVSSLQSRGASGASVLEFLNNVNNRIFMYCDDPVSQEVARRYNEAVFLNELEPGRAFVVKFDAQSRRRLQYVENLQISHDELQMELAEAPSNVETVMEEAKEAPSLEMIFEILESKDKEKQEEVKKDEGPRIPGRIPGRIPHRMRFNEDDDEEEEPKSKIPNNMQQIVERFPHFFKTAMKGGRISIQIPNGWVQAFENALDAFARTGLEVDICNIFIGSDGNLTLGATNSCGVNILDSFLKNTHRLCPICGNELKNKTKVCEQCALEFNFYTP
ncbi:type IV secretory system conjugative DNA transfer family protein [Solidesulfovibrio magneticus]|uniref:Uncharacterized protein n=1 Tax=Solidesulfovibrio magneticus (strain ATCC 700980 / DSM 13731 / RS-1) TaxID=573370 RepID=C4XNH6_SOLM1|nr:type IV secretory system conjugative DNA transfer family protein [Solidesulfovibrio magneticus]BAH74951.1 hypothetical protein DMR_14600 [Solidesulfovibrio magneticus RS-1]